VYFAANLCRRASQINDAIAKSDIWLGGMEYKMKHILKLTLLIIASLLLAGCSIESVSEHDSKLEAEASSFQALADNTVSANTIEPSGESSVSLENTTSVEEASKQKEYSDTSSNIILPSSVSSDVSSEPTPVNHADTASSKKETSTNENRNAKKETSNTKNTKNNSSAANTTTYKQTSAQTTKKNQEQYISVTVTITCKNVVGHSKLNTSAVVPVNGIILNQFTVTLTPGDNAFQAIKYACSMKSINFEYQYTPMFNSYYIYGINYLYENECGTGSGWKYSVNNISPSVGCNNYIISDKDVIEFYYTVEN